MNYTFYSTEDFLKDEKFINWVKTSDPKLNTFWEEWIIAHPEKKQTFLDAKLILLNLDFKKDTLTEREKISLWNDFENRSDYKRDQSTLKVNHNDKENSNSTIETSDIIDIHNNNFIFPWYKIAVAMVLIFTLAGVAYFIVNTNQPLPEKIVTNEIIKRNPKGQKLTTYLPDGSKVILNSLSNIRYKVPFNGNERVIELDGEAYFEVKSDVTRPFKVISNGVTTTALGTSFNINSKNDDFVEIALISGKVLVAASMKSVTLNPGKSAIVKQNGELQVQDFDYTDQVGWKDGILVFNNNSLTEIITKLEDWYGVEFKVDINTITKLNYHYSGKNKNETLDEVLHGISFVYHFEYMIQGDSVELNFK